MNKTRHWISMECPASMANEGQDTERCTPKRYLCYACVQVDPPDEDSDVPQVRLLTVHIP